jgi:hypothetical protein
MIYYVHDAQSDGKKQNSKLRVSILLSVINFCRFAVCFAILPLYVLNYNKILMK